MLFLFLVWMVVVVVVLVLVVGNNFADFFFSCISAHTLRTWARKASITDTRYSGCDFWYADPSPKNVARSRHSSKTTSKDSRTSRKASRTTAARGPTRSTNAACDCATSAGSKPAERHRSTSTSTSSMLATMGRQLGSGIEWNGMEWGGCSRGTGCQGLRGRVRLLL